MLFSANVLFAQNKIDLEKQRKFNEYSMKQELSVNISYQNGLKMLSLAQNDYEKALSYIVMSESTHAVGDYLKTIDLSRKAQFYINKSDSIGPKIRILQMLIFSYRRAGLLVESDENWKELEKLAQKMDPDSRKSMLLYTEAKIYDIDLDFCKAADVRQQFYDDLKGLPAERDYKNRYLFSILSQLAYVQIECGRVDSARINVDRAEQLKSEMDSTSNILLLEFHLMNKGLLAVIDKQAKQAQGYFDQAYALSKSHSTNTISKLILTKRIESNIDKAEDQLKYAKQVAVLAGLETTITKKLTSDETIKRVSQMQEKKETQQILIAIVCAVLLLLAVFIYSFIIRNKKLKKRYQQIIDDINAEKAPDIVVKQDDIVCEVKEDNLLSAETENEILKNLALFEKKKLFTKKGISLAHMAVHLKTNTKYLSYILKKYRKEDFYNYINDCRINYIVEELLSNPILRQYKIAVLSDMCGYNTHSQFASIFKQKKGISPSQYINFLLSDTNVIA